VPAAEVPRGVGQYQKSSLSNRRRLLIFDSVVPCPKWPGPSGAVMCDRFTENLARLRRHGGPFHIHMAENGPSSLSTAQQRENEQPIDATAAKEAIDRFLERMQANLHSDTVEGLQTVSAELQRHSQNSSGQTGT
jgi:hypothetical protein